MNKGPTMSQSLEQIIEAAFADAASINSATTGPVRDAVNEALSLLDTGAARVAEKIAGQTGRAGRSING